MTFFRDSHVKTSFNTRLRIEIKQYWFTDIDWLLGVLTTNDIIREHLHCIDGELAYLPSRYY